MRIVELYRQLLGLSSPWSVDRVALSPEEKRIDVQVAHRRGVRFPCPECGLPLPVADHVTSRAWRHLDSGSFLTRMHARIPRVRCLWHGTHQISVPWALPRSQFTTAFERWAIDVLRENGCPGSHTPAAHQLGRGLGHHGAGGGARPACQTAAHHSPSRSR